MSSTVLRCVRISRRSRRNSQRSRHSSKLLLGSMSISSSRTVDMSVTKQVNRLDSSRHEREMNCFAKSAKSALSLPFTVSCVVHALFRIHMCQCLSVFLERCHARRYPYIIVEIQAQAAVHSRLLCASSSAAFAGPWSRPSPIFVPSRSLSIS